jgi:hypothetical protein
MTSALGLLLFLHCDDEQNPQIFATFVINIKFSFVEASKGRLEN